MRVVTAAVVRTALILGAAACGSTRDAVRVDLATAREGILTVAADVPAPGFWEGDAAASVAGGFEWGLATALMELLNLSAPHGSGWELLTAVLVIILGPILAERLRIPGMIGLLLGGWLIGPNGLDIVPDGAGIVAELGEVGLLYLMFMAGLELDLAIFNKFRRQAVSFALLTFFAPLGLGYVAGRALDYDIGAALLLGSLFASHTLVTYPVIRRMGLATNPAVAVAVGATIVTDTLALMVLAVVSGSTVGTASGIELVIQIVLGLVLLVAWCFVVLPRLAAWFFTGIGQQRTLRYLFLLGALLSAAVLAEMLAIEAIVGAFFAGLAINRFVPNESSFMERVEFFGSALFIPMFLVSVGTIIDPAVMADLGTIGLALIFVAACLGGKLVAAALCRPFFRFSWNEVGVVFALTSPQAAATLAATFVGLQIGLFTVSVVNAVMLLIVASLFASSIAANTFGRRLPRPPVDTTRLGRSVLVQVAPLDCGPLASIAARLAASDGGVIHPVVVVANGDVRPEPEALESIEEKITALGIDVELEVRYDATTIDGIVHASEGRSSSVVVAPSGADAWLPTLFGSPLHALVSAIDVPVVLVRPGGAGSWKRVVLALGASHVKRPGPATELAIQVANRLASSGLEPVVVTPDEALAVALLDGVPAAKERTIIVADRASWVRSCGPADVIVVPGGRNGAIDTARTSKNATTVGATVVAVADRTSVTPLDRASTGLNVVGLRSRQL
jgi:Kef-type K+ transport system membrane component KefB